MFCIGNKESCQVGKEQTEVAAWDWKGRSQRKEEEERGCVRWRRRGGWRKGRLIIAQQVLEKILVLSYIVWKCACVLKPTCRVPPVPLPVLWGEEAEEPGGEAGGARSQGASEECNIRLRKCLLVWFYYSTMWARKFKSATTVYNKLTPWLTAWL